MPCVCVRGDVGGPVGAQGNFVNAEVGKNLAAESHLAENELVLASPSWERVSRF